MNHTIDGLTRFRRRWWPAIDDVLSNDKSPMDGYAVYPIYQKERVGLVREPVQDVSNRLRSLGFSREPVAALKLRASEPRVESAGSWVLKGDDIPHEDDERKLGEMQLHITLFALDEGTEVNAHYEYRWEPWAPTWDTSRPMRHKRPSSNGGYYSPEDGVAIVEQLFDEHNIPYEQ